MKLTKNNLLKFLTKNNIDFSKDNSMEMIDFASNLIMNEFNLDFEIVMRSDAQGTDYWLQVEYYSEKISKNIIFDCDYFADFTNNKDFVDNYLITLDEVKEFENKLKFIK